MRAEIDDLKNPRGAGRRKHAIYLRRSADDHQPTLSRRGTHRGVDDDMPTI